MTRRHFLPLLATAPGYYGCRQKKSERLWRGVLFHNPVSVRYHFSQDLNDAISSRVQALDAIFSLSHASSELASLNAAGSSSSPSQELVFLLQKCRTFHQQSQGLFDPTIQSYWSWLNEQNQLAKNPSARERRQARARVDFGKVQVSAHQVQLNGTELTLNAVAQGFATDEVTQLLLRRGVRSALVNLGEYRAIGGPFKVEIRHPSVPKRILKSIALADESLAVSSGSGHRLSAVGTDNHLLSPTTGESPPALRSVTILAPQATTADAWATILSLNPELASHLPPDVQSSIF